MQPMTAIATPGRWPVLVRICSVTSCRSKSVRPHEGHETYSVLVLRMREPCNSPNDVRRRNSRSSCGASMSAPSPSPSTSRPPSHEPVLITSSSRAALSGNWMWWITGTVMPAALMTSNTRRDACTRDDVTVLSSTTTGLMSASARSSASLSVPSTDTAKRTQPSGSATPPAACAATASRSVCSATAPGSGSLASTSAGAITCTVTSCRRRSARRPSVSLDGGISRMRMESDVAMSLNGMPTASFAPSLRYMTSACLSPASVTAENTVPSRCSRPR
mmetsp:Transcript_44705/g.133589  ORF Transcript_44705/g.133589 Transcript_44705/m.133589 type:complete len:276 (+) Transcript_44705:411-1238(+)